MQIHIREHIFNHSVAIPTYEFKIVAKAASERKSMAYVAAFAWSEGDDACAEKFTRPEFNGRFFVFRNDE